MLDVMDPVTPDDDASAAPVSDVHDGNANKATATSASPVASSRRLRRKPAPAASSTAANAGQMAKPLPKLKVPSAPPRHDQRHVAGPGRARWRSKETGDAISCDDSTEQCQSIGKPEAPPEFRSERSPKGETRKCGKDSGTAQRRQRETAHSEMSNEQRRSKVSSGNDERAREAAAVQEMVVGQQMQVWHHHRMAVVVADRSSPPAAREHVVQPHPFIAKIDGRDVLRGHAKAKHGTVEPDHNREPAQRIRPPRICPANRPALQVKSPSPSRSMPCATFAVTDAT